MSCYAQRRLNTPAAPSRRRSLFSFRSLVRSLRPVRGKFFSAAVLHPAALVHHCGVSPALLHLSSSLSRADTSIRPAFSFYLDVAVVDPRVSMPNIDPSRPVSLLPTFSSSRDLVDSSTANRIILSLLPRPVSPASEPSFTLAFRTIFPSNSLSRSHGE